MNIPTTLYRAAIFLCLVFLSSVLATVGMHRASNGLTKKFHLEWFVNSEKFIEFVT